MEAENEIKKWLETGNFVSEKDVGKSAVVIGIPELKEGKYGQKLSIDLELIDKNGNHETRTIIVGKLMARDMAKKLGEDVRKWLGAKGKITLIKAFNPEKKALFDKPIFELI